MRSNPLSAVPLRATAAHPGVLTDLGDCHAGGDGVGLLDNDGGVGDYLPTEVLQPTAWRAGPERGLWPGSARRESQLEFADGRRERGDQPFALPTFCLLHLGHLTERQSEVITNLALDEIGDPR
jgi:hypothetical protein